MTPPRQILPGQTVAITCRAVSRSFRFVPVDKVVRVLWFVFAYAVSKFDIDVHDFVYMSNHYHLVLTDRSGCLPDFMNRLNSLTSRALNALRGSTGTNIEKGYVITSPQDTARILEHCAYALANPCAADLVKHARQWRGLTSARMRYGETITIERPNIGLWKRAAVTEKPRRGRTASRTTMPETVDLTLVRPPTSGGEDPSEVRERILARVAELEEAAERKRAEAGTRVLGMRRVRALHWSTIPRPEERFQRTPRVSATRPESRVAAIERMREFVRAYREALALWRTKRKRTTEFPAGTWLMRRRFGVRCAAPSG